ncbi:nucleotide exchange factor GrpE [Boudabousia tangfeifanii]|uniref:Protein GrpE n=1 Tax=Boudabousia tangfeifanii TaxID=1912795 RepID=A0A1D9MLY0_9ACTO|nr:nucleotide exchange factor GrpE [Boudabousia tangfeifanii]AOZ73150.1 nucleotide exchange factor GrpE [Boudabousia tangfeifanii]
MTDQNFEPNEDEQATSDAQSENEQPQTSNEAESPLGEDIAQEAQAWLADQAENGEAAGEGEEDGAEESETDPRDAKIAELEDELARTRAQLYNTTNQYNNYVRRSKEQEKAKVEEGKADAVAALFSVMDDIHAARSHEEITGPFAGIVNKLEETFTNKLGVEIYGEVGDVFDPAIHEALMAQEADVTEPVVGQVFQPGFKLGERVLRPARVVVHNPA